MVAPFMGEPLSECNTRETRLTPSRRWVFRNTVAACAAALLAYVHRPSQSLPHASAAVCEVISPPHDRPPRPWLQQHKLHRYRPSLPAAPIAKFFVLWIPPDCLDFFWSTSSAAVSANALSLRLSSDSSCLSRLACFLIRVLSALFTTAALACIQVLLHAWICSG